MHPRGRETFTPLNKEMLVLGVISCLFCQNKILFCNNCSVFESLDVTSLSSFLSSRTNSNYRFSIVELFQSIQTKTPIRLLYCVRETVDHKREKCKKLTEKPKKKIPLCSLFVCCLSRKMAVCVCSDHLGEENSSHSLLVNPSFPL